MTKLLSDDEVMERVFDYIDTNRTHRGTEVWHEPAENYRSQERFDAEIKLLRRLPVPFCPSASLPEAGSYLARTAAGTPLVATRGDDGIVRVFRNACRHRGMKIVDGEGCSKLLVCPYHSWSYDLNGALKNVPGADGFPGLEPEKYGLKQVTAEERGGLVFVTQEAKAGDGALTDLPDLLTPQQQVFDKSEFTDQANWKIVSETSMEGYHIKSLHNRSFYPYQFDNLNVVETYGQNSRITFPFRRIRKFRDKPKEDWNIGGMVTYVYQLFPNTHLSVLSNHSSLVILEPVSPDSTRYEIFRITNQGSDESAGDLETAKRDANFVKDEGLSEDRDAACRIQENVSNGYDEDFFFGEFEAAIVHFHKNLTAMVGETAGVPS